MKTNVNFKRNNHPVLSNTDTGYHNNSIKQVCVRSYVTLSPNHIKLLVAFKCLLYICFLWLSSCFHYGGLFPTSTCMSQKQGSILDLDTKLHWFQYLLISLMFSSSEPEAYLGGDPAHGGAAQHGEGGDSCLVLQPQAERETHQPLQQHHPSSAQPDLTCCDAQSPLLQPAHGTVHHESSKPLLLSRFFESFQKLAWYLFHRWMEVFPDFSFPLALSRYRVMVCPKSPPASAQQVSCNYCLCRCRVSSIND